MANIKPSVANLNLKPEFEICTLAFSSDTLLAVAVSSQWSRDSGVEVWDADKNIMLAEWRSDERFLNKTVGICAQRTLVAPSQENETSIWDWSTDQCVRIETRWAHQMAFSQDGNMLATVASDESLSVDIWDCRTGRNILSMSPDAKNCGGIAFAPDGDSFAVALCDSEYLGMSIPICNLRGDRLLEIEPDELGYLSSVAFSPDGAFIATTGPTISIWNSKTGRLVERWGTGIQTLCYSQARCHPRPDSVVATFGGNNIGLLAMGAIHNLSRSNVINALKNNFTSTVGMTWVDYQRGEEIAIFDNHSWVGIRRRGTAKMVLSDDGKRAALANDNDIVIWELC